MIGNAKWRLREAAKFTAFTLLGNGPLLRNRLRRVLESGVNTILNLHRVADEDGSDYRPLNPRLFDDLLAFVKREFAIVTVGELAEKTNRSKLVLSFDDGYRDFITHAAPLLKRHGLRANQNIIPQCIETGLPPLNVLAQDFVGKAPNELVERLEVEGFSAPRNAQFGQRLSHFLKMRTQAEQDLLAADLVPQFFAWESFQPTQMMNLDEVKEIGHHELGAHSYSHASMEYESDEYLDDDVRRCSKYFDEKLGRLMTIYAFPNGSCRSGQAERVLKHGVKHVLLVGDRFDRGDPIHTRFTFDGRSKSEVRFKALGGRVSL